MKRLVPSLILALAAGCAPKPPLVPAVGPAVVPAAVSLAGPAAISAMPATALDPPAECRLAANGGPVLAERGIGGTGIDADGPKQADRGIGGTGMWSEIPRSVVRGLTDTRPAMHSVARPGGDAAVVGVITGFGGICIDGFVVALDGSVPMQIDDTLVQGTALRAGQVAVIEAVAEGAGLRALHLSARHEVIGPIERQDAGGRMLTVAGQSVSVAQDAWSDGPFGVGDWVAVSGLRRPDGTISATRLDRAPKGMGSLRGQVTETGSRLQIGALTLLTSSAQPIHAGDFVAVAGTYGAGTLRVDRRETDLLAQDPTAFFGGATRYIRARMVVAVEAGRVMLHGRTPVPLAPTVTQPEGDTLDAVLTLERGADGGYAVTRIEPVAAR